jgi:hypothetical protein
LKSSAFQTPQLSLSVDDAATQQDEAASRHPLMAVNALSNSSGTAASREGKLNADAFTVRVIAIQKHQAFQLLPLFNQPLPKSTCHSQKSRSLGSFTIKQFAVRRYVPLTLVDLHSPIRPPIATRAKKSPQLYEESRYRHEALALLNFNSGRSRV